MVSWHSHLFNNLRRQALGTESADMKADTPEPYPCRWAFHGRVGKRSLVTWPGLHKHVPTYKMQVSQTGRGAFIYTVSPTR